MSDLIERLRDKKRAGYDVMGPEAADELERLRAERDALRADAERYRHILSYIAIDYNGEANCDLFPLFVDPPSVSAKTDAEQVSAAIDAAISGAKKP